MQNFEVWPELALLYNWSIGSCTRKKNIARTCAATDSLIRINNASSIRNVTRWRWTTEEMVAAVRCGRRRCTGASRLGEDLDGVLLSLVVPRASTESVGVVLSSCYSQLESAKSGETPASSSVRSHGPVRRKKKGEESAVDDLERLERRGEAERSSNVDSSSQWRNSGEIGLSSRVV
jgi:hypothetical protein